VYNALVKAIRSFPDSNRFSVLSAATLLSFALTQVIEPSPYTVHVQWLGKSFSMVFHLHAVLVFLAAALTATGMDWLLRGHPSFKEGTRSFEHWILPAMTALILGISLAFFPAGAQWWAAFGVGGVLLTMVFWAEYVALEPADPAYPFATAGLIALSFAIFLILTVILRYAEVNLAGSAAAVFFSAFFVSLRALHLRLSGEWKVAWAGGIALIVLNFSTAFYFYPMSPLRTGIFLLAPLYALTHFSALMGEGLPPRRAVLEPLFMLGLILGIGFLFG
jgi:hypothetical protein